MRGTKGQPKAGGMFKSDGWQAVLVIIIIAAASLLIYKTIESIEVDDSQAVMAKIQAQTEEVQSLNPSKERSAYLAYIKQWAKEDRTKIKVSDSEEISELYEDAIMVRRQEQNKSERKQLIKTANKPSTDQP